MSKSFLLLGSFLRYHVPEFGPLFTPCQTMGLFPVWGRHGLSFYTQIARFWWETNFRRYVQQLGWDPNDHANSVPNSYAIYVPT